MRPSKESSLLIIRDTKESDIPLLARVYQCAYNRPTEGERWSIGRAKAVLNFYFKQKSFIGLTALFNTTIVGAFFSFVKPWHDGNHLGEGELFIDPKFQGKKAGTVLFLKMMKLAKNKKCVVHELVAYPGVSRWYQRIGMKKSGLLHLTGNVADIIRKIDRV